MQQWMPMSLRHTTFMTRTPGPVDYGSKYNRELLCFTRQMLWMKINVPPGKPIFLCFCGRQGRRSFSQEQNGNIMYSPSLISIPWSVILVFTFCLTWKREKGTCKVSYCQVNHVCLIHFAQASMRLKPFKEDKISTSSTPVIELHNRKGASQGKVKVSPRRARRPLWRRLLLLSFQITLPCVFLTSRFANALK